ncbi:hypothetical protein [Terrabacter sp. NPDC080008]|uniref:hypothetical protein n=1 Tax=Terrabacter sp. NPDC080008 TaxID=3155176 RepID=UPI00344BF432
MWDEIQQAAGVRHPSGRPYHVHETRHTTATLPMEAGVDHAVIEVILGQAVLVKDYLHVNRTATLHALEQVAARLTLVTAPSGSGGEMGLDPSARGAQVARLAVDAEGERS